MRFRTEGFFYALSFLTRLGKPNLYRGANFASALPWFGLVGACIGVLSSLFALLPRLSLNSFSAPQMAPASGWLWVAGEIWLSRCLHWDGAGDLGDAIGSRAEGEKFWLILKDSRIGIFGVMTLLLLFSGQLIAASLQISALDPRKTVFFQLPFFCLCLAPAWSRLSLFWLGLNVAPVAQNSLADLIHKNFSPKIYAATLAQGFCCLALLFALGASLLQCAALATAQYLLLKWFQRQGIRHGGVSGDFYGSEIECSQLLFLVFTLRC